MNVLSISHTDSSGRVQSFTIGFAAIFRQELAELADEIDQIEWEIRELEDYQRMLIAQYMDIWGKYREEVLG